MTQFNSVWRKWKPWEEYYLDPWQYFVDFIQILKDRECNFLTMSQALRGEYDDSKVNVVLDHHIDHYPLETEIMAKWELENDVKSSIYLFNRYPKSGANQIGWNLEDLNLNFYQMLERRGFEFGYHQNVIGQVRHRRTGTRYGKESDFDHEFLNEAKELFRSDVENLRRYFDIKTFIPHGGGESNTSFRQIPDELNDLVWVYNFARSKVDGQRRLPWVSFSDASGPRFQRYKTRNGTYWLQRDNLHVVGHLAGTGLNHILTHPGRYAKGMPYHSLDYYDVGSVSYHEDASYKLGDGLKEPLNVAKVVEEYNLDLFAGNWTKTYNAESISKDMDYREYADQKYWLFTDSSTFMHYHMSLNRTTIPFYIEHRENSHSPSGIDDEIRPKGNSNKKLIKHPATQKTSNSLNDLARFYNILSSPDLLNHLCEVKLVPKVLHVENLRIEAHSLVKSLSSFVEMLDDSPPNYFYLRALFSGEISPADMLTLSKLKKVRLEIKGSTIQIWSHVNDKNK